MTTEPELLTFTFETVTVNFQGEIIEKCPGEASYFREDLGNGVSLDMVYVPGGSFVMGVPDCEDGSYDNERPQHQVTLQPFSMGKYAVTQAQWRAVANLPQLQRDLDPNPSQFTGDERPVECVNWYDAVEFCARLSVATGRQYCLPSEAQWEYACRARTTTPFHFGETITTDLANYDGEYFDDRKPGEIYRGETTIVGSFPPNHFGLYDMHGNVFEWCADSWHGDYEQAPTDGRVWDDGHDNRYQNYAEYLANLLSRKSTSVFRGGSWMFNAEYCRSGDRDHGLSWTRYGYDGFRVVCVSAKTP